MTPELTVPYLLLFAAFVVPGAVSIFVYRINEPTDDYVLRDIIIEAMTFSVMNFAILFWPILYSIEDKFRINHPFLSWIILVFCLFIVPGIWPIILLWVLKWLESKNRIIGWGRKVAWDKFFESTTSGCWVIAHLADGERIGGRFSKSSYATSYPREGHLYIQELWSLDEDGNFVSELPGPQGAILRPGDYLYVRVFKEGHNRA